MTTNDRIITELMSAVHTGKTQLPDGFYISTPVGHYNVDWEIVF